MSPASIQPIKFTLGAHEVGHEGESIVLVRNLVHDGVGCHDAIHLRDIHVLVKHNHPLHVRRKRDIVQQRCLGSPHIHAQHVVEVGIKLLGSIREVRIWDGRLIESEVTASGMRCHI